MQAHIETTHKQLGELAAMAHQTAAAEQQILVKATELLGQVQDDLVKARANAMTGGDAHYQDLVAERGRLQQVIAQARQNLSQRAS